jgi:RimJ/RimL family protein N-acetyltransferase
LTRSPAARNALGDAGWKKHGVAGVLGCMPKSHQTSYVNESLVHTSLAFRAIEPADRDRLMELFARLTPESRYRRFLTPKSELTARELAYMTDIDHVTHEAIAAIDRRDGSMVGVGRYASTAKPAGVAEIAVAVADDWQGMGVGGILARRTVQRASVNGIALLTATTLWENRPARGLLRGLGFRARASHAGVLELELELYPSRAEPSVVGLPAEPLAGR